ncbi:hypothetical protein evm_011407 [Chilo suppressalis]|nr:hypothetical protein evm_011407 [Chilo suppressalis]
MEDEADSAGPGSYEKDLARIFNREPYVVRMFESPTNIQDDPYSRVLRRSYAPIQPAIGYNAPDVSQSYRNSQEVVNPFLIGQNIDHRKNFALTPLDKGYFDSLTTHRDKPVTKSVDGHHEGGGLMHIELQTPRQTRQNPNLSKTKHLIAEHLDQLRSGLLHEDSGTTEKPPSIHMVEAAPNDPADSIYGIAVIAAVGTALVLTIIGFAFGWYTMTKRAKAAADVDYPAYGVTGPTIDMTGDRKLAHSAHMYHYQHQKQQIIAMERNGMEQRNGSISEPESEEENEEGDYTVYECPGFATTGDMEVKNPLFSEEPTPATPGKCELVKPQPKE